MALSSLCPEFETDLMSNRKVIELVLQSKSAKAHGKNYVKIKPHMARHLLRNRQIKQNKAQPSIVETNDLETSLDE